MNNDNFGIIYDDQSVETVLVTALDQVNAETYAVGHGWGDLAASATRRGMYAAYRAARRVNKHRDYPYEQWLEHVINLYQIEPATDQEDDEGKA